MDHAEGQEEQLTEETTQFDDYGPIEEDEHESPAELDGRVDEEENGGADQAIALEIFDLINHQDIWNISSLQSDVLEDTRMTAWALGDFCTSSGKILNDLTKQYEQHAKAITDMKKDLDAIFKRTRTIKANLYAKYPAAKMAAMADLDEDS